MRLNVDVDMTYRLGPSRAAMLAIEAAQGPGQTVMRSDLVVDDASLTRIAGEGGVGTRVWAQGFANWYNTEHRHSAIRFVTPDQRHRGEDRALLASRHQVYDLARAARPERWSGQTRNWHPIGSVWLNPERPEAGRRGHGAADALPHKAGGGGPMAGPAKNAA